MCLAVLRLSFCCHFLVSVVIFGVGVNVSLCSSLMYFSKSDGKWAGPYTVLFFT